MNPGTQKVIIRNTVTGEEKEFPKTTWDHLGKSTNGWVYVRNADPTDHALPKAEAAKSTSHEKYIPAEVKSMRSMAKTEIPNPPTDFATGEPKADPATNTNLNPAGEPAASPAPPKPAKSEEKKVTTSDPNAAGKAEAKPKSKPGPKPKK